MSSDRQTVINDFMKYMLTMQMINKLYHFNTNSFARHKAVDNFDTLLQEHIDRFTETYIGRYKVKPIINNIKIDPEFIKDDTIDKIYLQLKKYLESLEAVISDTDLLAIRDELLADINKTLYLFTLN